MTNTGLDELSRNLSQLEAFSLKLAYNISEEGVLALARNCKKLRIIEIVHNKKIEEAGIRALVNICTNLKYAEFSHETVMSRDWYGLPEIKQVPYTSNAKKLYEL